MELTLLTRELEAKLDTNPKLIGRTEVYKVLENSKANIKTLTISENNNKLNVNNMKILKICISEIFKIIEDIDNKLYFKYHKSDEELIKSSIAKDSKFHFSKLHLSEKCKKQYNKMKNFINLEDDNNNNNNSVDSMKVDLNDNFNRDYVKKLCLKILELLNDIGDIDTNDECKTDLAECNVRYDEMIKECEDFMNQCLLKERKSIEYNLYDNCYIITLLHIE